MNADASDRESVTDECELVHEHLRRPFDETAQLGQESRADGSVDDAVVAREREGQPLAGDDRALPDDGLLTDFAHGEDGSLGWIDDGGERIDAEHAEVRDAERSVAHLFGPKLLALRARREVTHFLSDGDA